MGLLFVIASSSCSGYQSACQQFLLGRRKLFVGQRTRVMKLGELLKLGHHVWRRCLLNRSCILHRGGSNLLCLRIGCALLIRLVILCLRGGILLRVLLLLVVVYRTGSADDNRRAYGSGTYTGYGSSHHGSSAQHINLLICSRFGVSNLR
jgi:hypothetical protein